MHRESESPVDPKRMKQSLSGCESETRPNIGRRDRSDVDALVEEVLRGDVSELGFRSSPSDSTVCSSRESPEAIENGLSDDELLSDISDLNHQECYESDEDDILVPVDSDDSDALFDEFALVEEDIRYTQLGSDGDEGVSGAAAKPSLKSTILLTEPGDVIKEIMRHGPNLYVEKQIKLAQDPAHIMEILGYNMPEGLFHADYLAKWSYVRRFLMKYVYERPRLGLNSIDDVVNLLRTSKKILVLTGAGISVSCGIPDFRSENGLYARIRDQFNLPEPECMFDIEYFRVDPEPFFSFAKEILPSDAFRPSFSHYFIRHLEHNNQLLRQYTQNIDTIEQSAGIEKVVYCHGSFSSAFCLDCKKPYTFDQFKEILNSSKIPYCDRCDGLVKPDIVFFGEPLPKSFDEHLAIDCFDTDLILVLGSSLKVHPVSSIPDLIPPNVPQILINRESLDHNFDIELLGNCDDILVYLFRRVGWEFCDNDLNCRFSQLLDIEVKPTFVEPIFHLFPGAKYNINGNEHQDLSSDEHDSISSEGLIGDPISSDESASELAASVDFPLYTGTDLPETTEAGSVKLPDIPENLPVELKTVD